jgi:regulatory protein
MPQRGRGRSGRGWDAAPSRRPASGGDTGADLHDDPAGSAAGGRDAVAPSRAGFDGDLPWEGSRGSRPSGGAGRGRGPNRGRPGDSDRASGTEPIDPAEKAREICLRLLAIRPRTRTELASALKQRGIDADVADEVLTRYGEVGMVDDRAFASAWVTSRHH